jgi:hypothetical protein
MKKESKKILVASSAAYILGMKPKIEIKGTSEEIKVFKEVLEASKDLYNDLQESSNDQVKKTLNSKNKKAEKFNQIFGWLWPF